MHSNGHILKEVEIYNVLVQAPFRMMFSISAMLHLFETRIMEKNLELVKDYDSNIPAILIGDSVRLHQIILNLLGNAVKFTHKGKITIRVHLVSEDDNTVTIEFSVKDTGIGIEKDKLDLIIQNFQQVHSSKTRLYEGPGLGLAIVKQFIELQGGKINMESTINEGTSFSFTLSFGKTTSPPEPSSELKELDTTTKNIKVLVVEDIALNQLLIKTLLDDFGFECDISSNGKLAVEKLTTGTYDIVLMDLQMPEMNGFEATEYIRNTLHSTIPILALTADVTTVDLEKCKAIGMDDYIAKPVDEKLLYNKITMLVKKSANKNSDSAKVDRGESKSLRYTDLAYLNKHIKSNPALMMQMISIYLEQTPPLINIMQQAMQDKDWYLLYNAVHKIIPSFSIVGIHPDFVVMAKKVQEFASTQLKSEGINTMVLQLAGVCTQACDELKEEITRIKMTDNEKRN